MNIVLCFCVFLSVVQNCPVPRHFTPIFSVCVALLSESSYWVLRGNKILSLYVGRWGRNAMLWWWWWSSLSITLLLQSECVITIVLDFISLIFWIITRTRATILGHKQYLHAGCSTHRNPENFADNQTNALGPFPSLSQYVASTAAKNCNLSFTPILVLLHLLRPSRQPM